MQENLDKAKAARRTVIRYIQLVQEEEYVGTLLDANEKVVEAIQLYDKVSPPHISIGLFGDPDCWCSCPNRRPWTLIRRMKKSRKMPSRLTPSTSVSKPRLSRQTALARFSNCKTRKSASRPEDNNEGRCSDKPLPARMRAEEEEAEEAVGTQICKISISEVFPREGTRRCPRPCVPTRIATRMPPGTS